MQDQFEVPLYLYWIATFTWSVSGAIVGVKRGFDEVGVFVIALVSAFGGGLIRDGLFLNRPPIAVTDPTFLIIVAVAVIVILVLGRFLIKLPYLDKLIGFIDAIGTPAFCIVGMQLVLKAGYPLPGVLLLGVISGTGGGILRDMMTAQVPALLQPGQFSTLVVLMACVLFLVLDQGLNVPVDVAGWITVAAFFIARTVTTRYNWRSMPVTASPWWKNGK
jgi:uncharacterized membrane protein YeiH